MAAGTSPTAETAARYSILSTSWGQAIALDYGMDDEDFDEEEDSSDEWILIMSKSKELCKLCEKLGVDHVELSSIRLDTHMRTK